MPDEVISRVFIRQRLRLAVLDPSDLASKADGNLRIVIRHCPFAADRGLESATGKKDAVASYEDMFEKMQATVTLGTR